MNKSTVPLRPVLNLDGLIVRSSGQSLIDGVGIRRARVMCDERGRLGEIMRVDDPWFERFGQVYFTTTYPGVVKAWHYHAKQTDHFYVVKGIVKLALYDGREGSQTFRMVNELYLGEHCPGLVRIPPGVLHGWMAVGQAEAYVVNVVSEPYNYAQPDEFRTDPHNNDIPYDWTRRDG
ncbi:MAG: dTDP-4-dehydrorhamnose 3,5-epimerase family protein [Sedimentisphaerales bacterium]|jgi:dTDP-4-dehydrorhamnose 3,5-epimerase|nr:dTDP-4-dehydrorhamnose 3,5-epimerase family protein [Sedimentisphaerales bacterium]